MNIHLPNTSFTFDHIYHSYEEAKTALAQDQVLIGRYVLVAYCEAALTVDERYGIETYATSGNTEADSNWSQDYQDYFINFVKDNKTSYDRTVFRKKFDGRSYYYEEIAKLNSTLSIKGLNIHNVHSKDKILSIDEDKNICSTLNLTYDKDNGIQLSGKNNNKFGTILSTKTIIEDRINSRDNVLQYENGILKTDLALGAEQNKIVLTTNLDKFSELPLTLTYDADQYIRLKSKNIVLGEFDASDFVKDSFLSDVNYDIDTNSLSFEFITYDITTGTQEIKTVDIGNIDIMDAGNGIDIKGNEISAVTSGNYLTVDENGIHTTTKLDTAIENAKNEAINATKNTVTVVTDESLKGSGTHVGDICIVKTPIYVNAENEQNSKYSYTAYVWNGTAWAAMDGNYNAANVYLDSNLIVEGTFTSIGNYGKGTTIAAGTSLNDILSNMLQKELYPTANDKPNAEITASGGNGEVGSAYIVPTATLTITDVGSYEYGDKSTGIVFTTDSVKLAEGTEPSTATNYVQNTESMKQGNTITLKATGDQALYTDEGASYTFSGTASYPAGEVPVTNLNNPYPDAQIPAGTVTIANKTVTFIGYRYGFAGGTNATTIDSSVVRGMTAKKKAKTEMDTQSEALEFTAHKGDTKIFFAYPASWGESTPYFEIYGLAWSTINDFVAKTDIEVADARGGSQGTTAYKLYVWEPKGGALTADETKFRVWFN